MKDAPAAAQRSSPRALTPTAASLLGFLHREPMTGWDLVRAVEGSLGDFWNVTRSQVYMELHRLADAGLVEAGETGARERRPYRITDEGRRAFATWIDREPGDETIRFPLLLTVFFAEHVPHERLVRALRSHQLRHQRTLEAYEATAATIPDFARESGPALTLRFGIEYERAVLRWFEGLPWLSRGPDGGPGDDTGGDGTAGGAPRTPGR